MTALLIAACFLTPSDRPDHADVSYGPSRSQRMDVWLPEGDGPFPCVVFFHGGGFFMGDKSMHRAEKRRELLDAGVAFASAGYRLSHEGPYPAPMQDAARAIQVLRSRAGELQIDRRRMAADGHSAGGAMALWLAFHDDLADPTAEEPALRESSRLTCVAAGHCLPTFDYAQLCNAFGCRSLIEHPAAYSLFGAGPGETRDTPRIARLIADASPMTHLTADDPPVFLYYGLRNVRVTAKSDPNLWVHHPAAGKPLQAAAAKVGVPVQRGYPGGRTRDRDATAFLIRMLTANR